MKIRNYTLFLAMLVSSVAYAQKIKINVVPADATIHEVKTGGIEQLLGTGSAEIKINKDFPTQVIFKKPGFKPFTKTYQKLKGVEVKKEDLVELKDRMVTVTAEPYDAKIFVNGVEIGTRKIYVYIGDNSSTTVEVTKPGYYKKSKTYYNQPGRDLSPVDDNIILEDKSVKVKLFPSDVQIFVDSKKLPDNADEIVIPNKTNVAVEYKKEGYVTVERTYYNKEGMPQTPLFETITLKDRTVRINTTPTDATIKVDGKQVATGEHTIKIVEGACVEVIVERPGFVPVVKNFCNQSNMQAPPVNDHMVLKVDEAYTSSIQSDQANVNFSITVGETKTAEDAWKIMNGIVTNYFDVIEMADKETSYIRTAWSMKNFPNNTIRTRVIVKPGNTGSLQYVVKIQSEYSGAANTGAKDDEKFKEWERLLNTYKDVISEMQARLK
ncbi:MAG: cadherin-like beta sandwich domain-containing protein [Bacteroidia bacterium]